MQIIVKSTPPLTESTGVVKGRKQSGEPNLSFFAPLFLKK